MIRHKKEFFSYWYSKIQTKYKERTKTSLSETQEEREKLISQITKYLKDTQNIDPDTNSLLEDISGFFWKNTQIKTGLKDPSTVSITSWQEILSRLEENNKIIPIIFSDDFYKNLHDIIEQIISILKEELENIKLTDIENIDSRFETTKKNFTLIKKAYINTLSLSYLTATSQSLAWVTHSGWGDVLMKEYVIDQDQALEIDDSNYMQHDLFHEIGAQAMRTATISYVTDAGDFATHGLLPTMWKKFSFTYKETTYTNNDIWEGLLTMQKDIRYANLDTIEGYSQIKEAITLWYSWYAYTITKLQGLHWAKLSTQTGFEQLLEKMSMQGFLVAGHNTAPKKLFANSINMINPYLLATDFGSAPKNGYRHGYISISLNRSLSSFIRKFGQKMTDDLISKNIISVKTGSSNQKYIELISESNVPENVLNWFNQNAVFAQELPQNTLQDEHIQPMQRSIYEQYLKNNTLKIYLLNIQKALSLYEKFIAEQTKIQKIKTIQNINNAITSLVLLLKTEPIKNKTFKIKNIRTLLSSV